MARPRQVTVLDELDKRLIELLQVDGRSPNMQIASQLGVSEGTVRRRFQNLIKDKVIRIVAIPDPTKLGFGTTALVGLQVDPAEVENVGEQLTLLREVQYVAETTGAYDMFLWIALPSPAELAAFLRNTVGTITGVRRAVTFLNLDIKKNAYGPGTWDVPDPS